MTYSQTPAQPNSACQNARDRAEARNDWYVKRGNELDGPFSQEDADELVARLWANGESPKLLKVTEDYEV